MRKFALLRGLMTFDAVTRLASPRAQRSTLAKGACSRAELRKRTRGSSSSRTPHRISRRRFDHGRAKEFKGSGVGTESESALTVGLLKEAR